MTSLPDAAPRRRSSAVASPASFRPAGGTRHRRRPAASEPQGGSCATSAAAPEAIYQWTPTDVGHGHVLHLRHRDHATTRVVYVRSDACTGTQLGVQRRHGRLRDGRAERPSRLAHLAERDGRSDLLRLRRRLQRRRRRVRPDGDDDRRDPDAYGDPDADRDAHAGASMPARPRSPSPARAAPSSAPPPAPTRSPPVAPPPTPRPSESTAGSRRAPARPSIETCGTLDDLRHRRSRSASRAATSGPERACNDDTAGCGTGEPNDHHGSRLTVQVIAGRAYFVIVGQSRQPSAATVMVSAPALKAHILQFDRLIMAWHRSSEASRRLDDIPGVGPALATALVATVADPRAFRSGRNFSAWIGLVPKRRSSGGKDEAQQHQQRVVAQKHAQRGSPPLVRGNVLPF